VQPFHGRISVNDDTISQDSSIKPAGFPPEVSAAETPKNSGYMTADRFTAVLLHQIILSTFPVILSSTKPFSTKTIPYCGWQKRTNTICGKIFNPIERDLF